MNIAKVIDIVYLGMVPTQHKSEGLNVLLSDAIKPMLTNGVDISIHTTNRHINKIKDALSGNGVEVDRINFEIYSIGSMALNILIGLNRKKQKISIFDKLFSEIEVLLGLILRNILRFAVWSIDLTSINVVPKLLVVFLAGISIVLVSLIVGIVTSAVFICFLPIYIFGVAVRKVVIKIIKKNRRLLNPIVNTLIKSINETRLNLAQHLYSNEQKRFASKINRNKKVTKLFFFTCFEGEVVKNVSCKKLVVFPDAVTLVFPLRFAGQVSKGQMEVMRDAIKHADKLVCYSEHVKKNQLQKFFPIESQNKQIVVIPQGYFKIEDLVTLPRVDAQNKLTEDKKYIKNFFPDLMTDAHAVDFREFQYIVYPTIDRPHKNTLTLLRAYSILLRQRYLNVKLILTTPALTLDVREYIEKERLHHDVIFMPSLPGEMLDILFCGASLMVHPSLAEGGDIFNFSRAVTAGCPALLSNIPVVREMFDRAGIDEEKYDEWLFEPTNSRDLANKMYSVLMGELSIKADQIFHLQSLAAYGFSEMSMRYLNCYESM